MIQMPKVGYKGQLCILCFLALILNYSCGYISSMVSLKDLPLISSGATSDVYLYDQDTVIKVFTHAYQIESVKYEANITSTINDYAIRAPKYHGILHIDDRVGILYDYVPGKLLFSELLDHPLRAFTLIKQLAAIQHKLNEYRSSTLPKQRDRFSYLINLVTVIPEYRELLLECLGKIPEDDYICHGDFHVGNIIQSKNEIVIIDWMNCYTGTKEGDILRSYLMLISPFIPIKMNYLLSRLFLFYKKIIGWVYLSEYIRLSHIQRRSLRKWWPLVAAARLADRVPHEEKWLLRKIKKNIKYLNEF